MKLRPYQEKNVEKALEFLENRKAVYIADEPGLGKTAQALSIAKRRQAKKILVLCPASLRHNWNHEFNMWYPENNKRLIALTSTDVRGTRFFSHDVTIASYDIACNKKNAFYFERLGPWDMVILDEAHYLKNLKTQRTKACLDKFIPKAHKVLFLSGTPIRNSIADAYPCFSVCAPKAWSNFWSFAKRYTHAKKNFWGGWEFKGARNTKELKEYIRANFFI
jgi:SWI/SNF-related matrix-associated actin-dependent regulator 1 of chromatin subfamily A